MTDEKKTHDVIPPGYYTKETLPPLSPKAQEIYDRVMRRAKELKESPEGKALRARAEAAYVKSGDRGDFVAIMLGAQKVKRIR